MIHQNVATCNGSDGNVTGDGSDANGIGNGLDGNWTGDGSMEMDLAMVQMEIG